MTTQEERDRPPGFGASIRLLPWQAQVGVAALLLAMCVVTMVMTGSSEGLLPMLFVFLVAGVPLGLSGLAVRRTQLLEASERARAEAEMDDLRRAVAEAADLPLIVYNIPGRTGVNMLPDTIAAMAESPNIVGVKEASGDLDQVSRIIAATDDDFEVLSGDDSLTLPMMAVGASGVISVTSNLVPARFAEMVSAAAGGDFVTARAIHHELLPLMGALFCETNPIPIKAAMAMAGLAGGMTDEVRLPLTPVTPASRSLLETALRNSGVID